jgi:hypothetical protein
MPKVSVSGTRAQAKASVPADVDSAAAAKRADPMTTPLTLP